MSPVAARANNRFRGAAAALLCLTSLAMSGCVGAPPSFTPNLPEARVRLAGTIGTVSASVDPAAKSAGGVGMTFGSDAIPAQWQHGLASALEQSRLFDHSSRVFDVNVTIYKMKPPRHGGTINTPARARYQVIDAQSHVVVFEAMIETVGHVASGDNFLGAVRIRDSINRAVQGNITHFVDRLAKVKAFPQP
ncbi:hypothetical protein [Polymorphobacter megasporae]|uniref:hypothetical protein n=1 Tax=Glacieibacterium megasporae TaxID=2835787 RepID=UPI001C1E5C77|nr:hypothetical protein [Polymorphobacter megasporae]UAJ11502.1 hypothetical protein KTC28_07475 [Polymorphobacter megasporae]